VTPAIRYVERIEVDTPKKKTDSQYAKTSSRNNRVYITLFMNRGIFIGYS
jgi:hypothetical protein